MTNRFTTRTTPSGHVTALHNCGTLIHSAQDPLAEAEAIASLLAPEEHELFVVIGNGLGYLSRALSRRSLKCVTIELFADLFELSLETNCNAADKLCGNSEELMTILGQYGYGANIVILPYIMSLRSELSNDLRSLVEELQVTLQSQRVYKCMIDRNIETNRAQFSMLERLYIQEQQSCKLAIAVGSGPTLDACMQILAERRDELLLVAASGAVPVLSKNGIRPDWIVAMEARNSIVTDLEMADHASKVLVFPWTHPSVLNDDCLTLVAANESDGICTSGGSTGLAATDFVSMLTPGAIFMIGMDMCDSQGEYSAGVARTTANGTIGASKFNIMRAAASRWACLQDKRVYHMVMPGGAQISGAHKLYPMELATALQRESNEIPEHLEAHV
ncbi:MAG: DUF115 domain-containing protein [bacterium]|nr:DUF115 domain-containing protein [bacterium]